MNGLFDLKYAVRTLLGKPKFTALAVIIMAAGLGISIYMSAFLSNLVFNDLPFHKGDEIFLIEAIRDNNKQQTEPLSLLDYEEIKEGARSFSDIGAYRSVTTAVSNGDSSRRYKGVHVTANIFDFFKMKAELGRIFNDSDLVLGAPPVTVITHKMWIDYFHKSPNVIGTTIKVNDITTEVVGVMPALKIYPTDADLWIPARENVLEQKRLSTVKFEVYARKLSTVNEAQANVELSNIMARLAQQYPETNSRLTAKLNTVQMSTMGNSSAYIVNAMIYAVILILVLACINVTNLLLVRANERAKETAIRLALGAPRSRLIIQMMWESVLICFIGGLIGVLGSAYCLELLNVTLVNITQGNVPFWWFSHVDTQLILQALGIITFTAFITGIVPAWKMTQCHVNDELRDGTRGATGKKAGQITRILVIIEVALSCILLVVAGVLYFLIEDSKNTDFGVTLDNKIHARVVLPDNSYATDNEKIQFFQRVSAELKSIPGVIGVGSMSVLPSNDTSQKRFQPEGYEIINNKYPKAHQIVSFKNSMQSFGIQLLEGRYFDQHETKDSARVVIITDSLAKKYWPNESPIGKRLRVLQGKNKGKWHAVIGVVKHVSFSSARSDTKYVPSIFQPFVQQTRRYMSNFIVVKGNSKNKLVEISNALAKVDPLVPVYQVNFMNIRLLERLNGMTFIRDLFSVFALVALLLAATGIYGVLSNSTSKRTQELGIRRALGATDENVMKLLLKQGWGQLLTGLFIGLPLGYIISVGFVQMMVPNSNSYYIIYAIVPIMIAGVVMFSTYLPAKKAIALEPSSALRYE